MRVKLGILGPLYLQVALVFLYSTIRYQVLDRALVVVILLLLFPSLILTVLAPFIIVTFGNLTSRIHERLDQELDKLVLAELDYESPSQPDNFRTIFIERLLFLRDTHRSTVGTSVKERLIPLLSRRALAHYKDRFYSRTQTTTPVKSLEYFESLVLFSTINMILLVFDIIIVSLMNFLTIDLYFLKLDKIEKIEITGAIFALLIAGVTFSYFLFLYSRERLIYYLPYVVPILFHEPENEQFFRRETIRSLMSYNLDNLADRRDQKKFRESVSLAVDDLLIPLLRDEFLVTARAEFANKVAWREYSTLINQVKTGDEIGKTILERFLLGEKIGPVQLNEKDLLGLNSDFQYILNQLEKWDNLNSEARTIVYFQIYRLVEYIYREISVNMNLLADDEEYNLYNSIKVLFSIGVIGEESKKVLHNLRYRRNKLMHEPGISLEVSNLSIHEIMDALNRSLNILERDDQAKAQGEKSLLQKLPVKRTKQN